MRGLNQAIATVIALVGVASCGPAPESALPGAQAVQGVQAKPTRSIDADLTDVTVSRLQTLYTEKRYSVVEVVRWHLDRIDRYNGIYGAIETVLREDALAAAARLDGDAAQGGAARGPLWGVPIVIKANTSVRGQVTTAGWEGFTRAGLELVAPDDATIVTRFRAAGAIIVGLANMPDLANSDTNRSSSFGRTGNAYDVRFSPGGSSGGVVTAVATNMAVLGNGTDTGNSIRMPAATSALVGVFPTRGLVSIAGITPLDWLLDNTGPIARTVADAAIALAVMSGTDSLDAPTLLAPDSARLTSYRPLLERASMRGKRFGVPAFVLAGDGIPFHGIPSMVPAAVAESIRVVANMRLHPETRALFMQAVEALRAAGAEVIISDDLLPTSFAQLASRVSTYAYMQDGTDQYLARFGPPAYRSADAYLKAVGRPLYTSSIGTEDSFRDMGGVRLRQRVLASDPEADALYVGPKRAMLAAYVAALDQRQLDGLVYPAIQMPPVDETMPQDGAVSTGPHSATSWINMIGVPAVVVPAGAYASGLPFGLEFSARPWSDGSLLAIAQAWEQATPRRKLPTLVERGLLPVTPARRARIASRD